MQRLEKSECWGALTFLSFDETLSRNLLTKAIHPRDVVVFLKIMCSLDIKTGKSSLKPKEIAELLKISESGVRASIARLLKAAMLARVPILGGYGYIVDPHVIAVGGSKKRAYIWKLFKEYHGFDEEEKTGEDSTADLL